MFFSFFVEKISIVTLSSKLHGDKMDFSGGLQSRCPESNAIEENASLAFLGNAPASLSRPSSYTTSPLGAVLASYSHACLFLFISLRVIISTS